MRTFIHTFACVSLLLCGVYCVASNPTDNVDCKFWSQLAYNLSRIHEFTGGDGLMMNCNSTCSSIACSGHVKQPVFFSDMNIEVDVCFGLHLNHCDNPVSMDYYFDAPSKNFSRAGKISHDQTYTISGLNFSSAGNTSVLIAVQMVRVNTSHVLMSVDAKVRMMVGGFPLFPYSEKIFPPTYIDVPSCTGSVKTNAPFSQPECTKFVSPATKPQTTFPATPPVVIKSRTYKKSCELSLGQCSTGEMCQVVGDQQLSKNGMCVCQPDHNISRVTGTCQPVAPTSPATGKGSSVLTTMAPRVTVQTSAQNSSGSEKPEEHKFNFTTVVIGSVAGGLLLIVVCVATVIYIGRRRRQAIYRGRQQLLTDNIDDDDDVNLVV